MGDNTGGNTPRESRFSLEQESLLQHMVDFPKNLPEDILNSVKGNTAIGMNGGCIKLERVVTEELPYRNMPLPEGYEGEGVAYLHLASGVCFAYDLETGEELANTMKRYGVTDRSEISRSLFQDLGMDSLYQKSKGNPKIASGQDSTVKAMKKVMGN